MFPSIPEIAIEKGIMRCMLLITVLGALCVAQSGACKYLTQWRAVALSDWKERLSVCIILKHNYKLLLYCTLELMHFMLLAIFCPNACIWPCVNIKHTSLCATWVLMYKRYGQMYVCIWCVVGVCNGSWCLYDIMGLHKENIKGLHDPEVIWQIIRGIFCLLNVSPDSSTHVFACRLTELLSVILLDVC